MCKTYFIFPLVSSVLFSTFFSTQGSSFTPSSGLYSTNNSVSNPANYTATQQVCVCLQYLYMCALVHQLKPVEFTSPGL